jgi:hypothetical protein
LGSRETVVEKKVVPFGNINRRQVLSSSPDILSSRQDTSPTEPPVCLPSGLPGIKAFISSRLDDISMLLLNSVKSSSRLSYKTGWNRWCVFVQLMGSNPYMTFIPPAWDELSFHYGPHAYPFEVACVSGFLSYLVNDSKNPVKPLTAFNYLSAVRFFLLSTGINVDFMDHNIFIQAVRRGLVNLAYAKGLASSSVAAADTVRLPLSIDCLFAACELLSDSTVDQLLRTASLFGYSLMCRVSEYLVTPTSNHHIRAGAISFVQQSVVNGPCSNHSPALVHLVADQDIIGVEITIRDSKNDPTGVGFKSFHSRNRIRSPKSIYDLTEVLLKWAVRSKPLNDQPFFSCGSYRLTPAALNKWLADVAKVNGLDPSRISSHSLRIGGASALAAANVPDYLIQRMGRWNSLAFLQYVRLASSAFSTASDSLTDSTNFTSKDMKLWNPAIQNA